MPRRPLKIEVPIEELSILDETGQVDAQLDPGLDGDSLLKIYKAMVLSRQLDERMIKMQRQGQMGTFAPTRGQEATQIGSVFPLRKTDWFVPSYRSAGAQLWRGWPIEQILLLWNGLSQGFRPPDGINDLPMSIVVGAHPPQAVGIGIGIQYRGEDSVVVTNFGDGAASEGDVHESFNFAAVLQAPVIFIVENNQYAISLPVTRQSRSATFAQKAAAYGMPGVKVDGNDILAMIVATQEAVDRARRGGGPTLIEAFTFRLEMHTTADDPTVYRKNDEVSAWERKDPMLRLEKYLERKKLLDDKTRSQIAADVEEELRLGRERYEKLAVANPRDVFDHLFESLPPELERQKADYLRRLEGSITNRDRKRADGQPKSGGGRHG